MENIDTTTAGGNLVPLALTGDQVTEGRRMYEAEQYRWQQIGDMFGVSRMTAYRHVVKTAGGGGPTT